MITNQPLTWLAFLAWLPVAAHAANFGPSAADYATLQEALDANRGKLVFVPPGDYEIGEKLRIRGDRSGLWGPGRIVQTNPDQPILEIEDAAGVRIRDLTLTRPEGRQETAAEGVLALQCRDLQLMDLEVAEVTGLRFSGNLFHPGWDGVSNTDLPQ